MLLDEIGAAGDGMPTNPIERAIVQNDLWAVFNWTFRQRRVVLRAAPADVRWQLARLQVKLAAAIRRLALTTLQIAALPDNYASAAAAGLRGLPADLLVADGPWVALADGAAAEPLAYAHTVQPGRSAVVVLPRLPGGRVTTLDYIRRLRTMRSTMTVESSTGRPSRSLDPSTPQFPPAVRAVQTALGDALSRSAGEMRQAIRLAVRKSLRVASVKPRAKRAA